MRRKAVLITGASGEIGTELVNRLYQDGRLPIITLDIRHLPEAIARKVTFVEGSILSDDLLSQLVSEYEFEVIFHLAALLSTRSEITPEMAQRVNVEGTLKLLELAAKQSQWRRRPVQFIFPSSIAAYGLPDVPAKMAAGWISEWEWNRPRTMYGCNKLYCEHLGRYYSRYYQQLAANMPVMLDFRAVRFPGLISAFTLPSGGTSDYGPEMIHAAARGEPYACFVREDAIIPFMAMPDAVKALLQLAEAPRDALSQLVYNVTSFSLTAAAIRDHVQSAFPGAEISFAPDLARQAIVDSWPAGLDDSAARHDWGWQPDFDEERAFNEYLIPNIAERYQAA